MLRVSFTLFNLQGTRSTAFQLSVRYILAHSFSLVKYFFQKFFRFLLSSALIQARSLSSRNSFILSHSFESVKNFFQVFSRFSTSNCLFSVLFNDFHSLERTCSFYHAALTLSSTFFRPRSKSVQLPLGFFSLFDLFQCPLVRRSDRIPPQPSFVNSFFHFSCLFSFSYSLPLVCYIKRNGHCAVF